MRKSFSKALAIMLTIALLVTSFVTLGSTPVFAADTVTTDEIVIGDSTYVVSEKSSVFDAFKALTNGKTPGSYTSDDGQNNASDDYSESMVDFSNSNWTISSGYGNEPVETTAAYLVGSDSSFNQLALNPNKAWIRHHYYEFSLLFNDAKLVVYPSNQNKNSNYISLDYTASKAGEFVLYDKTGKIKLDQDSSPLWAWDSSNTSTVTVYIYKNDTLLWSNEDNLLSFSNTSIDFPDLKPIKLEKGEVLTVKYATSARFSPVLCDLAVAQIYEEPPIEVEEKVIKGQTVMVEKNGIYDAYSALNTAVSNTETGSMVDLSSTPWGLSSEFDTWGKLDSGYRIDYSNAIAIKPYDWTGFHIFECLLKDDKLIVNPGTTISESQSGFMAITYTAPKSGTVTLYNDVDEAWAIGDLKDEFWPWWDQSWKLEFKIKVNGEEIWPAGDTSANNTICPAENGDWHLVYPTLRNITLKKGDVVSFEYSCGIAAAVHVETKPMIAYTHEHDWAEPEVKAATYIIAGEKKTACNTCTTVKTEAIYTDEAPIVYGDIKYNPATDELTIPFSYSESFLEDLVASSAWTPFVQLHYTLCGVDYKLSSKLYFYDYQEGGVITLTGFNAERLSEDFVIWFTLGWDGNNVDDNPWASPESFDTDTTKTIKFAKVTDENNEKYESYNEFMNKLETAEDTVVKGTAEKAGYFVNGTIQSDLKAGKTYLRYVFDPEFVKEIKSKDNDGRVVTLSVTIGNLAPIELKVKDLTTVEKLEISGMSFGLFNSDIKVKYTFDFANDDDIVTEELVFSGADAVSATDTELAKAFATFMG